MHFTNTLSLVWTSTTCWYLHSSPDPVSTAANDKILKKASKEVKKPLFISYSDEIKNNIQGLGSFLFILIARKSKSQI